MLWFLIERWGHFKATSIQETLWAGQQAEVWCHPACGVHIHCQLTYGALSIEFVKAVYIIGSYSCLCRSSGQFIAAWMFYLCNFCSVFDTPSWFAQMIPASWSPSERKQKWGREPMLELRCLNVYISGCQFLFLGLQSDVHARRRWPSGVSHGYKAYNKSNLGTTWLWLARSLVYRLLEHVTFMLTSILFHSRLRL